MANRKWEKVPEEEIDDRAWESVKEDFNKLPKKAEESGWEDFVEGMGVSALKSMYGLKDMLSPEEGQSFARPGYGSGKFHPPQRETKTRAQDKAHLKDWQKDAAESGYGTAGEIVGDGLKFAIPGTAVYKYAKGAGMGLKSIAGLEALTGGAIGGTDLPGEDETRLGNAAFEGGLSLLGSGIGAAGGPLVSGIQKTKAGELLHDFTGKMLTPGQTAESPFIKAMESFASVTPFLGKNTNAAKEVGEDAWSMAAIRRAALEPEKITRIGNKGYNQIKSQFNSMYNRAWNKSGEIDSELANNLLDIIEKNRPFVNLDSSGPLNKVAAEIEHFAKNPNTKTLKEFDKFLRERLGKGTDVNFSDALWEVKNAIRDSMPEEAQKLIRQADEKYPEFLTIQRATDNARNNPGSVFNPAQLMDSSSFVSSLKEGTAGGSSPLFDIARVGRETVGQDVGGAPLEWMRRLAPGLPGAPGQGFVRKMMMGDNKLQGLLQSLGKKTGVERDNPLFPIASSLFGDTYDE